MTTHAREQHSKARLDGEAVRYIRTHPEENNAALARRFSVSRSTIRLVRENVTWRDPAYVPMVNPFRGSGLKGGGGGARA